MINYWLSFYCPCPIRTFELHSPWWRSGLAISSDDESMIDIICAAVKATSEENAKELIYRSFDVRPEEINFRFCGEKRDDWSPFTSRFPKSDWMVW